MNGFIKENMDGVVAYYRIQSLAERLAENIEKRQRPYLFIQGIGEKQKANASWLLDKPFRTTHEHQGLRRSITWGQGIYQLNGYAPTPTDPANIQVEDKVHVIPAKTGQGRGKSKS